MGSENNTYTMPPYVVIINEESNTEEETMRKQPNTATKPARNATKQALKPKAGRGGVEPPAERQFGKPHGNPRHNGAWKKEDTARFKLEQMLKMTEAELNVVALDSEAPLFERKLAGCIAKGNWKEIESMINQVYGYPKQSVDTIVRETKPLVDLTKRKKNGEDNGAE